MYLSIYHSIAMDWDYLYKIICTNMEQKGSPCLGVFAV